MLRPLTPKEILKEEEREQKRIWRVKRKIVSDFMANSRYFLDPPEVNKDSAAGFLCDFVDFRIAAASASVISFEEREIILGIEFEEVAAVIEDWVREGPSFIANAGAKSFEAQGIYFDSVRCLQDTLKLARFVNKNISASAREE